MPKCPKCGTEMGDSMECPNCAKQERLDRAYDLNKSANDEAQSGKGMAILAYIIFLIPLLVEKENKFVKYHTNQGFLLFLFAIAGGLVGIIPVLGWLVSWLAGIATFVFAIIGILNAYHGEQKPLPLIGNIDIQIVK